MPVVDINHRFREILSKSRSQSNDWQNSRLSPFQHQDANPVLQRVDAGTSSPKHQRRFRRNNVLQSDKGTSPFKDDQVMAADIVNSFAAMGSSREMAG